MAKSHIMDEYLVGTVLVDVEHPTVIEKAIALTDGVSSDVEKVKNIYHFVRDEIPYTFTRNHQKASEVLKEKVGQCNSKTTLTIALLRAVGIPARYHCGSVSKALFKNVIPWWAYPFTPDKIPGHCWTEVFLNNRWVAIENVVDLQLYKAIRTNPKLAEGTGCSLSEGAFHSEWDGKSDVLMQEGALVEDLGTYVNADQYLEQAELFLHPVKRWIKDKLVKQSMNKKFRNLRKLR